MYLNTMPFVFITRQRGGVKVNFKHVIVCIGMDWCLHTKKFLIKDGLCRLLDAVGQQDTRAMVLMCGIFPLYDRYWETKVKTVTFNWFLLDIQWRIQDFPEGGREPSRGGVNPPNFPENCMKSKEFGRPGGGVRPSRPP